MGSYGDYSNSFTLSTIFLLTICATFYASTGMATPGTKRRDPPSCEIPRKPHQPRVQHQHQHPHMTLLSNRCQQLPHLPLNSECRSANQLLPPTMHRQTLIDIKPTVVLPFRRRILVVVPMSTGRWYSLLTIQIQQQVPPHLESPTHMPRILRHLSISP